MRGGAVALPPDVAGPVVPMPWSLRIRSNQFKPSMMPSPVGIPGFQPIVVDDWLAAGDPDTDPVMGGSNSETLG
jgi:hypothetical protein